MTHSDTVARWLAIGALVVAFASFLLALRTHRRAGARVKVAAVFIDSETHVLVTVRNSGLAGVQIVGIGLALEHGGRYNTWNHDLPVEGEELPCVLEGNHEARWTIPIEEVLSDSVKFGIGQLRIGDRLRCPVVVRMGSGLTATSQTLTMVRRA